MAKGMEVKYRSSCGRYEVNLEASDQQALFAALASFQEIFEDDTNVSIDGVPVDPKDIKFRVRTVAGNEFYEKVYTGNDPKLRGYKMEYGSQKENKGSLFPKKKDKDDQWYKNNGWHKWEGNKDSGQSGGDSTPPASDSGKKKAPF